MKRRRGDQQRKQRAGHRHRLRQHVAQDAAAQAPGDEAAGEQHERAHRGRLDRIEEPERDRAEQHQQERHGDDGEQDLCAGRLVLRRTVHSGQAASDEPCRRPRHSTRNSPAGTSAPWKTSCVLMTRSLRPVAVTAMVCAPSIASPSRISTSEGGITTPSVAATATSAARVGSGTPCFSSRGATTRERPSTLAPTEPFIGPSSAPSPMPEIELRGRPTRQDRQACPVERLGDGEAVKQQSHQHIKRQRLEEIVFKEIDQPAGQRGEQRERHDARRDAECRSGARDTDQHESGGQSGEDDPAADEDEQHKP